MHLVSVRLPKASAYPVGVMKKMCAAVVCAGPWLTSMFLCTSVIRIHDMIVLYQSLTGG